MIDIRFDEKEYIDSRVDKQIDWYDTKSIHAQKMYKIFTFIILVSSAIIPFIANLTISSFYIKVFVSILGVLGTISQGVINVNKYNENWIEYRTICESLKKEKYMYLTRSGVYSEQENRFSYFAERIESIISQENVNWASLNKVGKGE